MTSQTEEAHLTLKNSLQIFTEDLKKVINKITLLLMNQHAEHAAVLNTVRMQVFIALRIFFF